MFNTLLNDNVLRIIRIKCVIRIIRNTRIKQLSSLKSINDSPVRSMKLPDRCTSDIYSSIESNIYLTVVNI